MDIAHQFQKIGLFPAKNGLISVLKKMAVPFMAPVIADGVPGQQTAHDGSHRISACSEKQVEMIGDQRPRIAGSLGLFKDVAQAR